jgi:hypothetical protein
MKFAKQPEAGSPGLLKLDGQILVVRAHCAFDKRAGRQWTCTCDACALARQKLLADIICREVAKSS